MWGHLIRRFFGSLRPGGPSRAEDDWARSQMLPAEEALWDRMSNPDRRHAAAVAREVERSLGHDATRPVLAAALLHDVGKIESGFRIYGRVIATLCGMVVGREQAKIWMRSRGFTRRVGMYLLHPDLGGDLLGMAGSDPLTESWTREHHKRPDQWTVDRKLADALKAADND
ncbi:MAG: hypothetical protein QOC92_440 [Acidimicrobiaceae bacterium]